MVLPTLSDEEVKANFPEEVTVVPMPSGKQYVRHVTLKNDNNNWINNAIIVIKMDYPEPLYFF